MAIFAHPGDAEIACGATLARWSAKGCAIKLVVCTQGDKGSHETHADPSVVSTTRLAEVDHAAEILGIATVDLLGYLDGEIENDRHVRSLLVEHVRAWRPEVVFGHDPTAVFIGSGYINHRDHREVGMAMCDAIAPAAAAPLYFPDAGAPHQVETLLLSGTMFSDVWIDVDGHLETKVAALRCHHTQIGANASGLDDLVTGRAGEGRASSGIDRTESFRRISLVA